MKIEIRHLEKVKEGILVYGLMPIIEGPPLPHYISEDTEEEKLKKNSKWKEELKIFDEKVKEVDLLHLGKAELIQKIEE